MRLSLRAGRSDDRDRQGGDHDLEFTQYARAAVSRLRNTAYLMCRDWHLADDLTQTTLTKLYVSWPRVRQAEDVDAYSRKVLLRTLLDHRRRRSTDDLLTTDLPEKPQPVADPADLRLTLLDALARIRPLDRAIVILRYWEDYSVAQVASMLDLSEGAVRVRSLRALATMRGLLDAELADLLD